MHRKKKKATAIAKPKKPRKFRWTPKSESCVDLLVEGRAKTQIAKELGIHRNTILLWMQHAEFAQAFEERVLAHRAETRGRRALQTSRYVDATASMLDRAFERAEDEPDNLAVRVDVKAWGAEFRAWREQERVELGENVNRSQVTVSGNVVHETHQTTLKDFLRGFLDSEAIDVEALPTSATAGEAVALLANRALAADPGVTDALHEEDRADDERAQR